jgi:small GTP-binding protein
MRKILTANSPLSWQYTMSEVKIAILGSSGSGKTSWVRKITTGETVTSHKPTFGVEVHPHTFNRNGKSCRISFYDTAGKEEFTALTDGYYLMSHGALLFLDGTKSAKENENEHNYWLTRFRRVCPNVPVVTIYNKCEGIMVDPDFKGDAYMSVTRNIGVKDPLDLVLAEMFR